MFTISLQDTSDNGILYTEAFQVPSQGYQNYTFSLSIIDSSLLDYDDENWQNFNFKVFIEETVDPSHTDEVEITVNLINWNDETPIFENEEYDAEIYENVSIHTFIQQVYATDRDVDDEIRYV